MRIAFLPRLVYYMSKEQERMRKTMATQRLDKAIASTGRWSRREVKILVKEGRVLVDGYPARSAEDKVDPLVNTIEVDGEDIGYREFTYIMLHKPAGVLTATEDKRRGQAVFEQLDMAVYTRKTFGMFGGDTRWVTLRCEARMAGVILDRFGQDTTLCPEGEQFTVRVPVAVSPQFFGWLAGLGSAVMVTDPAVAAQYRAYLDDILAAYTVNEKD